MSEDIKGLIESLPRQLAEGVNLGSAQRIERPYRMVVSCGMGGSAIAGEMLSMTADNLPGQPEFVIQWDYGLPEHVASQDLVICTSWSGRTEETISSYMEAVARGCEVLVITSGGELADLASKNGSPLILLPKDTTLPRMAIGYMVGAIFAALGVERLLPAKLEPIALEKEGQQLAEHLDGRMVIIYSSYPWRKLTGFWKMAYSETVKRQVFVNWFPSGAHTEIVGWEGPYQKLFTFVFLRDKNESEKYADNFRALLAILPEKGYTIRTIELSGDSVIDKALNNYVLALWTSFYSAKALDIDPAATKFLDEFKKLKS